MAKKVNLTRKTGDTGTNISSGVIIGEEYNPKLRDVQLMRVVDEMVNSDATVNASLEVIKQPIKGADYEVDPASEDEKDKEIAEFVNECLFNVMNWDKALDEILTHIDYGFYVGEMLFEPREVLGKYRIALIDIEYRKQTTITKWEQESGQPGIHQIVADGKQYDMPWEKVLHVAYKMRGKNYAGKSILRPAYKHWYMKDKFYKYDAVAAQKAGVGVLDVTMGAAVKDTDKQNMRKAARSLRANEESYIEHPETITAEFMDMKAGSLRDMDASINHHDRQIMKNILAQFLEIGSAGSSGTRNVSEDQSRMFEKSVGNLAKAIVYAIQTQVIKTMVDVNFTDVKDYPKLRVSNLSDDNIPVFSDAVGKLVTAGILHPRGEDENTVRKMVGLPQLSDEELEEIEFNSGKPVDEEQVATDDAAAATKKVNPEKVDAEDLKASAALKRAQTLRDELNEKLYGTAGYTNKAA